MPDHTIEMPPYDSAAQGDTLGLRHLHVALDDLTFPMTTSELRQRAGNWRMPITGAHFHTLDDFLDGVDEKRFRGARDVVAAVARAHPQLQE